MVKEASTRNKANAYRESSYLGDRSTVHDEVIKLHGPLHVFELGVVYHTKSLKLLQDKMVKDLVGSDHETYGIPLLTSFQTFDVRYDNELAHDYYGDGKQLAEQYG
ncbi:unnamed protein product [Aspergillus oryzae]|uniref:Unnamed protein product n=2 Tax=Aspergillus oryzae TaxID=5062 RepID=A0AAN5BWQ3_ASPOZ|nr:unnamed protein product [Aspergillus oryzae]GMF87777.1 unnamed protein product [Aspergillus oryzae]GMG09657.1 unnamed protein product [Aspergillus oryzae]GMG29110.1 unnamed protein product [Aspergillus oryzae]